MRFTPLRRENSSPASCLRSLLSKSPDCGITCNRSGRGQVGPCLTDEAHRPLPERRSCVSRYASARTLQKRSLRQFLQVESSYLLCHRPTQLLALIEGVSRFPLCQGTVFSKDGGRTTIRKRYHRVAPLRIAITLPPAAQTRALTC
jgi:hypothetical protein